MSHWGPSPASVFLMSLETAFLALLTAGVPPQAAPTSYKPTLFPAHQVLVSPPFLLC
jgi:hypothetical protein